MGAARSIGILTVLNALGGGVAVLTSVVVAHFFGTTRALEVFFAASTLETSLQSLTQTGQLGEIFLPVYHRIKQARGLADAQGAFAVVLNWMVLVVAALSIIMWLAAPLLVLLLVPGFGDEDRRLGVRMFRCLIPLLGIQVVLNLVQTLSNAERWFGRPEAINVSANAIILIGTAALASPLGIWAMVAAYWAGNVAQLLGYVGVLWRMGYRHRFRLKQEGFSAWSVFSKLFVTFGYVGATQVYLFALNAGMSRLPQGTYAVFRYVQQLYIKTNGILLRPVSVVFFTHVSEALSESARNVRELARAALARSLAIGAVVIVAAVACARPLLGGLWGGKRFGPEYLDLAAFLMGFFYLSILPSALGQIARKSAMAVGMVKRQYLSTCAVQLVCAGLAVGLIKPWGIAGGVATVMFNAVGLALAPLAILLLWRRDLAVFFPLGPLWKWTAAALVGAALGWAMRTWLGPYVPTRIRAVEFLWAGGLAASAVGATLALAWALNVYEVREAVRRVLGPLKSRKAAHETLQ